MPGKVLNQIHLLFSHCPLLQSPPPLPERVEAFNTDFRSVPWLVMDYQTLSLISLVLQRKRGRKLRGDFTKSTGQRYYHMVDVTSQLSVQVNLLSLTKARVYWQEKHLYTLRRNQEEVLTSWFVLTGTWVAKKMEASLAQKRAKTSL